MKAHITLDMSNPMAASVLGFLESLPFAEVEEREKLSFEQASAECNAVSLETFIDALRARINAHYDKLESA
jgi:hypothetical protein